MVSGVEMLATGAGAAGTLMVAVPTHPLALVTVTLYGPLAVMRLVAVVSPFDQRYVV
ncbi:hypothetical protein D3C83_186470 [compost metagenome]